MPKMYDNYFDHTRPGMPYTHSHPALDGTYPASNAVRGDAKPTAPEGFHPGWDSEKKEWVHLEDHIGKQGYVNDEPHTIKEYGPEPDGWGDTPPPQPFHPGPDYEKQEDGTWLRVRYTRKDFMLWCGIEKLTMINAAIAGGNVLVETVKDLLMAAEFISIKDPDTVQMAHLLASSEGGSILTPADVTRILAGQTIQEPEEAAP